MNRCPNNMKSSLIIEILAILLLNCANLRQVFGQADSYQLNLGAIDTNEVQLKATKPNEYELSITEPESQRVELISLEPNNDGTGAVVVTRGRVDTNFPNDNVNLVVNYVADRNGYRASYRLGKGLNDNVNVEFGPRLSIKDLMSLAG